MSTVAIVVIVVVAVAALFLLIGVVWFAYDSNKRVRDFAHATDLIPGKAGRAPQSWTTDTSREALLHQRIRYAMLDVHQNPALPHDDSLVAARDRLDDAAFALDDRLIAVSATADGDDHDDALARAEKAIKALEKLPKKLWEAPTDQQLEDLTRVTDALRAGAAIE